MPASETLAMRLALATSVSFIRFRKSLRCTLTGSRIVAVVSAASATLVR